MVADHANYLTFEDPGAVNTVRRALKLAQGRRSARRRRDGRCGHRACGDRIRRDCATECASPSVPRSTTIPRARPDAQNIVEAMRPDGIIRSVYFVPIAHPEKGGDWLWPFDNEEFSGLLRSRRHSISFGSCT